jgi:hypothetical protein
MSAIPNVNTILGKGFVKLSGTENYIEWCKAFYPIATINGVYNLYKGKEPILDRPKLEDYITLPSVKPTTATSKTKRRTADAEIVSQSSTNPDQEDTPVTTATGTSDYAYNIAIYNIRLSEWKDNEKSARFALALLQVAVEPWLWDDDWTNPNIAWTTITKKNEPSKDVLLDKALSRLDKTKFQDFKSLRELLVHYDDVLVDIQYAGGSYKRSQLINNITRILPSRYNAFITHWRMSRDATLDDSKQYSMFKTQLLRYSDDNKDRWQEQDNKKRTDVTTKATSSNAAPKATNRPKCNWCANVGHTEDKCKNKEKGFPRITNGIPFNKTSDFKPKVATEPTVNTSTKKAISAVALNTDHPDEDRVIVASAIELGFDLDMFESSLSMSNNLHCTSIAPLIRSLANATPEQTWEARDTDSDAGVGHMRTSNRTDYPIHISPNTWLAMSGVVPNITKNSWLCDSGASVHIVNDRSLFVEYSPHTQNIGTCSDNKDLLVKGKGTIEIQVSSPEQKPITFRLGEVRYAPNSRCNLFSIPTVARRAYMSAHMDYKGTTLFDSNNRIVAYAPMTNGLYILNAAPVPKVDQNNIVIAPAFDSHHPVWHEHRLRGHLSLPNMLHLLKISDGMNVTEAQIKACLKDVCPICWTTRTLNKIPREPARRRFQNPGHMLVIDSWGPYPIPGLKGERYAIFITDDATRFTWVIFMVTKDTLASITLKKILEIETVHNVKVRIVRFDNEFVQQNLTDPLNEKGVGIEPSVPYAHHHAGTGERNNRTVRERTAAILQDHDPPSPITRALTNRSDELLRNASLPEGLWTYAMTQAVWLKNRSPTRAHKNKKTPYEALLSLKPNLQNDHIWGARVYVSYAPEVRGMKLHAPRGWVGYYLCAESETICKVWDPEKKQVKRITSMRVDDYTGEQDPQPGTHINERRPHERVNIPEQYPSDYSDDSEGSDTSDNEVQIASMADPMDDDPFMDDDIDEDWIDEELQLSEDSSSPKVLTGAWEDTYVPAGLGFDPDTASTPESFKKPPKKRTKKTEGPTISTYFAKSTEFVTTSDEESETDEGPHLHNSNSEPGRIDTAPCTSCLKKKMRCKPGTDPNKCTQCVRHRTRCVRATEEELYNCANCCSQCNKHSRRLTCNGETPCNHCKDANKDLSCRPKMQQIRADLPAELRCALCRGRGKTGQRKENMKKGYLGHTRCDGTYPCNVCTSRKRPCIRKENEHRDKCKACENKEQLCNREDYCNTCIAMKRGSCSYRMPHGYMRTYKEPQPNQLHICGDCSRKGYDCTGEKDSPCMQCLTIRTRQRNAYKYCAAFISETKLVAYRKDHFEYHEIDDHSYSIKPKDDAPENLDDLDILSEDDTLDNDIAMMITLDTNTASEDDRLDGDLADLIDTEDEDIDEDLQLFSMSAPTAILDIKTPRSYNEAMKLPEAQHWDAATWKEINALIDKDVFKVVQLPSGKRAIPAKLVYKLKLLEDGSIEKYKARIVARGFMQKKGIDYTQSWSPTVRAEAVRILLAIITILRWIRTQVDIPTAYLNADLPGEVYLRPPYPVILQDGEVWRLNKALYGLVESARAWYQRLRTDIEELGFRASAYDPCVYIHNSRPLIVSVHVDDIGIYAADNSQCAWLKKELFNLFNIDMQDDNTTYLGMHIHRTENLDSLTIHQSGYVAKVVHQYKITQVPSITTPCDHRNPLVPNPNTTTPAFKLGYLQRFGSANFLPTTTRPDLAYAVSLCGRFNANPSQEHLDAINRILTYAGNTPNTGIKYTSRKGDATLHGYVDADWAGCKDSRRSTTGWVFTFAGGPVSWSSTRQKVVALSTCEAEYMAAGEAVKEACWIKRFINDLGTAITIDTIPIHVDNDSAIKLTDNPEQHQRSKHIDIRHHFIRERISAGDVSMVWISGKENPADMFTKALSPTLYNICRERLHLSSTTNHSP